jgi:hypothetical protein
MLTLGLQRKCLFQFLRKSKNHENFAKTKVSAKTVNFLQEQNNKNFMESSLLCFIGQNSRDRTTQNNLDKTAMNRTARGISGTE